MAACALGPGARRVDVEEGLRLPQVGPSLQVAVCVSCGRLCIGDGQRLSLEVGGAGFWWVEVLEVDFTSQVVAVGGADFGQRVDPVLGAEHDHLGHVVVEMGVRCAVQGAEALCRGRLGVRQLSVRRKKHKLISILTQKNCMYCDCIN